MAFVGMEPSNGRSRFGSLCDECPAVLSPEKDLVVVKRL
jgi:hypothetical protein